VFLDYSKENKVLETTNLNYDDDDDDDYSTINSNYEFKGDDTEVMEVIGCEDDSSSSVVSSIISSVVLHPQANLLLYEAERTAKNNENTRDENFCIATNSSNEKISPSKGDRVELRLKMKETRDAFIASPRPTEEKLNVDKADNHKSRSSYDDELNVRMGADSFIPSPVMYTNGSYVNTGSYNTGDKNDSNYNAGDYNTGNLKAGYQTQDNDYNQNDIGNNAGNQIDNDDNVSNGGNDGDEIENNKSILQKFYDDLALNEQELLRIENMNGRKRIEYKNSSGTDNEKDYCVDLSIRGRDEMKDERNTAAYITRELIQTNYNPEVNKSDVGEALSDTNERIASTYKEETHDENGNTKKSSYEDDVIRWESY
jgi:hypothetical protein